VLPDSDVVAGRGRRPPHRQPRRSIDVVEQVEELERGRRRITEWRQHDDRVASRDLAIGEDAGVHPRVRRVGQDRDAAGLAVAKRALDNVAWAGGAGQLEDEPSTDREARPDRQPRQLDARRRDVFADRARLDRVPIGLDPLDRLDAEERHGPVRPAVDEPVAVGVALQPELSDPRPVDGQLRHAARRDVHLEHASVHCSRC
jgi:hypothetical protein